jgi:hypothetical protein
MKNRMWIRNKQADGLSMAGRATRLIALGLVGIGLISTSVQAQEGPREHAKRIHDRLAGVPPTDSILNLMEAEVDPGQPGTPLDAAYRAMQNPNFYNVTLKKRLYRHGHWNDPGRQALQYAVLGEHCLRWSGIPAPVLQQQQ